MKNIALNKKVIEDWDNPLAATNGNSNVNNYAATKVPKNFTLDLGKEYEIENIRFRLFDKDDRQYRYRLLTSTDNNNFVVHYETLNETFHYGWQDFYFVGKLKARYLRIHAYWNSKNQGFHIVQFEAYENKADPVFAEKKNEITISTKEIKPIELGDGFPLTSKLIALSKKFESLTDEYEGLNKDYFKNIVNELKMKTYDVSKIENSLESVRREIITPVKAELKTANIIGKTSIRLGYIGGILGIISILINILFLFGIF